MKFLRPENLKVAKTDYATNKIYNNALEVKVRLWQVFVNLHSDFKNKNKKFYFTVREIDGFSYML